MGCHFLLQRIFLTQGSNWVLCIAGGFFTDWTTSESESEVAQSYLTLCDPMDCSLPHSSIQGIFQARVLEWVAVSFSRGSYWPRDQTWVSRIVGRCFIVWTIREAHSLVCMYPFCAGYIPICVYYGDQLGRKCFLVFFLMNTPVMFKYQSKGIKCYNNSKCKWLNIVTGKFSYHSLDWEMAHSVTQAPSILGLHSPLSPWNPPSSAINLGQRMENHSQEVGHA